MNFTAPLPSLRLSQCRHAYLVGIKGVGMTSLAVLLQQAGLTVAGADTEETFVTDQLLAQHQIVPDSFASAILPDKTDVVIYSGAHQGANNPLVKLARTKKIPTLSQAEALGLLSVRKETIAVAGVGGKSTTAALLSWILEVGGQDPSYSVGVGNIPNLGSSGRWRKNRGPFVVEADEYVADPTQNLTPRFLYLRPKHLICTSLSYDHPDVYQSLADTQQAFSSLLAYLTPESILVYNGDLPVLVELVRNHPGQFRRLSVGEGKHNQVRINDFQVVAGVGLATIIAPGLPLDHQLIRSPIPGKHNLLNAVYAAVMAAELGVDLSAIDQAITSFRSTQRRFEYIGRTLAGCECYDDYAHHPREIVAIGETLHDWFPGKKLAVAFEPHTFSRTKALYADFLNALEGLKAQVFLLPIFASARETEDASISSVMMADDLTRRGVEVRYCPDQTTLLEYIQALDADTVLITLGAGTIYKVYAKLTFNPTTESLS